MQRMSFRGLRHSPKSSTRRTCGPYLAQLQMQGGLNILQCTRFGSNVATQLLKSFGRPGIPQAEHIKRHLYVSFSFVPTMIALAPTVEEILFEIEG